MAHFPRDIMRSCCRVAGLSCAIVCIYVYRYCGYWLALVLLRSCCCAVLSAVPCWCGLLSAVPLSACFPSCARVVLFVAVAIWCNRVTMRCNRFSVSGGVVLPCARSCDSGAFYKRLLLCWLMVCGRVGLCRVGAGVGWRVLLSADSVRMRCIGFMYADIYLYTVAVGVDCGAFSCSCGDVVRLCIYVFVLCGWWWRWCGCIYVSMYICRYCACVVWCGGLLVSCCAWIYLHRDGLRLCSCIHLPAIALYSKIKQFSRLNAGYMQKTTKSRIFCMDICKTTQKIKIENHACTCAICIYHLEN